MTSPDSSIRNILLEVSYSEAVFASAMTIDGQEAPPLRSDAIPTLSGVQFDVEFGAVEVPQIMETTPSETEPFDPYNLSAGQSISEDHKANTFLMRGTCKDTELASIQQQCGPNKSIQAVYSDPEIQVCAPDVGPGQLDITATVPQICPGSSALGTDRHVAVLLGVPALRRRRMDGSGVYVAIVDTGINLTHLIGRGKRPILDATRSWMARPGDLPGRLPVGHGTMVAYDTMIAAPRATLLDIALLRSTRGGGSAMAGLLSDAIRAYAHLYRVIRGPHRPGAFSSMVVNNSWGMFHESWDFPVGHPGRYSDNPAHPFNRIVGILEQAGADILFAAGNCGRECSDRRCRGATRSGIFGANSHPQVLSVAGVDVLKRRVGYSTSGPGKLMFMKPDICGYTHFRGSGVYPADGGTSAATPVVAGLIAAFRSRFQYNAADYRTSPATIRNLLTRTAEDRGSIGFDYDYGWGIANGNRLALIHSLSITQATEETASSIDELSDVEMALDNIEGLDEVPETQGELEAAHSEQSESVAKQQGRLPEELMGSIIGEYVPQTGSKTEQPTESQAVIKKRSKAGAEA